MIGSWSHYGKYLFLLLPCMTQVVGVYVLKQWLLKIDHSSALVIGVWENFLRSPGQLMFGMALYGVSFFMLLAAIAKLPMTSFFPVFLGAYIVVGVLFGFLSGDGKITGLHMLGVLLILVGVTCVASTQ